MSHQGSLMPAPAAVHKAKAHTPRAHTHLRVSCSRLHAILQQDCAVTRCVRVAVPCRCQLYGKMAASHLQHQRHVFKHLHQKKYHSKPCFSRQTYAMLLSHCAQLASNSQQSTVGAHRPCFHELARQPTRLLFG